MPITTPPDYVERYGGDTEHFVHVADHIFKPAAEAAGFKFTFPRSVGSNVVQADIIKNLEEADLVLCDMTCWNANVFFELGIRVARNKPVAMIRDTFTEDIPFDNIPVNAHTYNPGLEAWLLQDEISRLQKHIEAAKEQTQNAIWKHFGITQLAQQVDPSNPEDARFDLILTELAALRQSVQPSQESRPKRLYSSINNLPKEVQDLVVRAQRYEGAPVRVVFYDEASRALGLLLHHEERDGANPLDAKYRGSHNRSIGKMVQTVVLVELRDDQVRCVTHDARRYEMA